MHQFTALLLSLCLLAPAFAAQPAVAPTYRMTYRLLDGSENWPGDKRQRVVDAMDGATELYNQLGEFDKKVTASYNAGVPTADGNYNGNIRFGGSISKRVALHELGHVLGIGTHPKWDSLLVDGKWTGSHALAQLRAFDGPDAVLYADRKHFWPYGLNYDRESSAENDRRHVMMVAAFRRDLRIISGQPFRGMVGVGTWETQAEFKDIKVTSGLKTLFSSDFSTGLQGWKLPKGQWQIVDGALRQTGNEGGARALVGEPGWSDYTLTLKARKLSGNEGFLIIFDSPDEDTTNWWNVGGWGNTLNRLEVDNLSVEPVTGRVETNRWYDIRLEIQGPTVKCYLDDQLVQQGTR